MQSACASVRVLLYSIARSSCPFMSTCVLLVPRVCDTVVTRRGNLDEIKQLVAALSQVVGSSSRLSEPRWTGTT